MVKMEFALNSVSLMNFIWMHSGEALSWDSSFWVQEQMEVGCDTSSGMA